ncbi:hypothetical protein [Heyndrickxia oleronia]|uniref:Uncharacterized protein n=1 Tax=Heyndrickxia oleronia TaxID=38875 RepID=A0AAW6SL86_9BACI|nr:hypothetical protein [Heyndrickxia oleronia]MDH5159506.1 hypothetical protein [Heyndrickxia oleronia]
MSRIWYLLKVQLLQFFGINKAIHEKNPKQKRKWIAILIGMIIGIVYLFFVSFTYSNILASVFEKVDKMELLLTLMMAVSSFTTLVLTMYKANGILFGFKDYDLLMALPMKTSLVVASRVLLLYIMNGAISIMIMVPACVVYAMKVVPDITFYMLFIITLFFIPLVPIIVATCIGSVIMMISARFKYANLLNLVITFTLLVLLIGGLMNSGTGIGDITNISVGGVEKVYDIYPLTKMYSEVIRQNNFLYFISFIGISIVSFLLYTTIIGVKFKSINNNLMTKRRNGRFQMTKQTQSSPFIALYRKELKRYFTTSIYVLNTGIGIVFYTVLSFGFLFIGTDKITEMIKIFQVSTDMNKLLPLVVSIFIVMTCTTMSSISLEGKNLWILQSSPIPVPIICFSKITVNLTITIPAIFVNNILILLVFQMSFIESILLFVLPISYALYIAFMGIIVNLRFPNFDWINEVTVVKQSVSALIAMIAGLISVIIPFAIIMAVTNINQTMFMVCCCLVLLTLCMFMYGYMKKKGELVFKNS